MESKRWVRDRGPRPVLVADDDQGILNVVSTMLRLDDLFAFTCRDGALAVEMFQELHPELVILDVSMPGLDGLAVCRKIRATSSVPIIMLTVMNEPRDAAAALEAGADDYVRKPFAAEELRARIRAVLRRNQADAIRGERVVAGPLVVDGARRLATVNGAELVLTPTEFALLAYLAGHAERALTHTQILKGVWGNEYIDSPHVLRVTMSRLRHKLETAGPHLIETLPRIGYRLSGEAMGLAEPNESKMWAATI
jgi:two-component system KDP operon response regulator KdpE